LWKINHKTNEIKKSLLASFEGPVWRVHWSFTGCLLAVSFASSSSDNTVRVYQENEKEEWEIISALEDDH
jgi:WD40 repeat protein